MWAEGSKLSNNEQLTLLVAAIPYEDTVQVRNS